MLKRAIVGTLAGALALTTGSAAFAEGPGKDDTEAHEHTKHHAADKAAMKTAKTGPAAAAMFQVERGPLMGMISTWPDKSQAVAKTFMGKYGLPDEATPTLLIWHDNGPWKRTIVYRDPVQHNFPVPHKDVVEQVVNYDLPSPDVADELAAFDGSVYIDRTAGELSAKCDQEGANFLALNLADDIVKGEKTVEEARAAYAAAIRKAMTGTPPEMMSALQFQTPPERVAGDPDRAVLKREELTRAP